MRHHSLYLPLCVALVAAAAACGDRRATAPTRAMPPAARDVANGGAPVAFSYQVDVPAGYLCEDFDIRLEATGKTDVLLAGKNGGTTLITAPGQVVRVTNLANQKQVTFSATGVFHQTVSAHGDSVWVATGRNVLGDPVAGFVLAEGDWTWTKNASGELIAPLSGTGRLTDICALIR